MKNDNSVNEMLGFRRLGNREPRPRQGEFGLGIRLALCRRDRYL